MDGAPPLAAVSPGDRIGRQQLTAFARRRAERLAPFLSDVRRLFEDARAPTLVMVEEGAEEVALWVALACAALPPAYAPTLTFTTYTRRPYLAEQQIVGVLADAEFGYASADLGHQFRFHHCLGGTSSEPRTAPWAAVAARVWLAGRPDLLVRAAADAPFDAEVLASRALYEGIPWRRPAVPPAPRGPCATRTGRTRPSGSVSWRPCSPRTPTAPAPTRCPGCWTPSRHGGRPRSPNPWRATRCAP